MRGCANDNDDDDDDDDGDGNYFFHTFSWNFMIFQMPDVTRVPIAGFTCCHLGDAPEPLQRTRKSTHCKPS